MQNLFSQIACAIVCGVKKLFPITKENGGGIHHHKYTEQRCMQLEFVQKENMKNENRKSVLHGGIVLLRQIAVFKIKQHVLSNHLATTFYFSHPQGAIKPSMNIEGIIFSFLLLEFIFSPCMCFPTSCVWLHYGTLIRMMTMKLFQVLTFIQPRKRKLFSEYWSLSSIRDGEKMSE